VHIARKLTMFQDTELNLYSGSVTVGTVVGVPANRTVTIFADGELQSAGAVDGNIANNGIVSPGVATGTLRVDGHFAQSPSGSLEVNLGNDDDLAYDQLTVAGTVTLAGTLRLVLPPDFAPPPDTVYTIISSGPVRGRFDSIEGLSINGEQVLWPVYGIRSVQLRASLPADLNFDGAINDADLAILVASFGTRGILPGHGADIDGDGAISLRDLSLLQRNWEALSMERQASNPIPEPSALVLSCIGFALVPFRKNTNKR
jgi:hypothetical protein